MTPEFNLIDSEEELSHLRFVPSDGLGPAYEGIAVNGSREFEFSFEVELDPRYAEELLDIDTHPMPPEWRDANR